MRIKFALAASLFAVSLAGAAFAQPTYSSDYTNDSDGFAPSAMAAPAVDKTATASINSLPPCHSMIGPKGSHTKGADSGASRTEACRATH